MAFSRRQTVGEDGYYMLTMAWYLAESGKLTDNHGELTTGTQPLATLIYAALAKVIQLAGGDRWTLVRSALATVRSCCSRA